MRLAHLGADYQAVQLENPSFRADTVSHTFPWSRYLCAGGRPCLAVGLRSSPSMGGALDRIVSFPKPELELRAAVA